MRSPNSLLGNETKRVEKTRIRLRAVPERQTLADQVYGSLKQAIIDGELRPGARLREADIALSLGASRTPVREALSRLEQEGLVQSLKSGGSIVVELSTSEMREIFGLIQVLETYAVRLAAEHITPKQLEKLEAICSRSEQIVHSDLEKLSDLNRRFHELIIEASGNQRLQTLITNLRSAMQPYRALTLQSSSFREQSVHDHRSILDLLRRGAIDELATLMNAHLGVAQDATLTGIQAQAERLARAI